jgi:hypothetical protein
VKRSAPLRRTPLKRRRKPKRSTESIAASLKWYLGAFARADGKSQLSGKPGEQVHHIAYAQTLRRVAKDHGVDPDVLLWDPRNAMLLTTWEHERHHNRTRPILLHELPRDVWAFAEEWRLVDYLRARYPE